MSVAYYFSACCLNIKNRSAGCSQCRKTDYNRDGGSAKKCDVLILIGNFERSSDVFCPTLILIAFFQIENGYRYRFKDMLMGGIPYYAYIVIYFIEVVIIGEENGGWPDIYHITDYSNPLIAVPLLLLFGFGISALVAATSNMISKRREAKLFCYWDKDADPVDVLIEAYALGIMTGKDS